jgi:hypothetical protein
MANDEIWRAVAQAGINVHPHLIEPNQWVGSTRWRQYGPYATPEEALGATIRGLCEQLEETERAVDRTKQWEWTHFLADVCASAGTGDWQFGRGEATPDSAGDNMLVEAID